MPSLWGVPPSRVHTPARFSMRSQPRLPMKRVLTSLLLLTALVHDADAQRGGRGGGTGPAPMRFQFLGPASGGRFAAIAGVVGDSRTWSLGAASGGVWKSTDSGSTFLPGFG